MVLLLAVEWISVASYDAVLTESRVTVISIEEGTRLAGEDAPKRKDLEAWLHKHPGFVVEGMEDVDTEDGEVM